MTPLSYGPESISPGINAADTLRVSEPCVCMYVYNYVYIIMCRYRMGFVIRPARSYARPEASDFVAGEVAALRMRV